MLYTYILWIETHVDFPTSNNQHDEICIGTFPICQQIQIWEHIGKSWPKLRTCLISTPPNPCRLKLWRLPTPAFSNKDHQSPTNDLARWWSLSFIGSIYMVGTARSPVIVFRAADRRCFWWNVFQCICYTCCIWWNALHIHFVNWNTCWFSNIQQSTWWNMYRNISHMSTNPDMGTHRKIMTEAEDMFDFHATKSMSAQVVALAHARL